MKSKTKKVLSAILIATLVLCTNLPVKAEVNDASESVSQALNLKTFYHFNVAYAKVSAMEETTEKYQLLEKLTAIQGIVWTEEINKSLSMLTELTKTASAKEYAQIENYVVNSKMNEWDKGYLLGELTSWGKKLVWTDDYIRAVSALGDAYTRKDIVSLQNAEKIILQINNSYSKDYLLEELNNLKLSTGYKEEPLLMPITIDGAKLNNLEKITENYTVRTAINTDLLFITAVIGGNYKHPSYLKSDDKYGINKKIKEYFGKYTENKSAISMYEYAMKINNPPKKFINPILPEMLAYDNGTLINRDYRSIELWDNLKQFSEDTQAVEFFKENKVLYDKMLKDFRTNILTFNPVDRLTDFMGTDINSNRFVIVLSTVMSGGQAMHEQNEDGTITQYNIMNPSEGLYGTLNTLYHETSHNFYAVRDEDKEFIQEYSKYANALGKHEADFAGELNETIARVVTAVMMYKYHGKEALEHNLNLVKQGGWLKIDELYTLVKENYLTNREKYKTFKDFVPVICEYLKASSLGQPFHIQ